MSYAITVYFRDECIDNTYIYTSYFTHRGYYGDDYYTTSGLTFSVKFTATPADNCTFTRWVYRLGSTSGTVQYSYDNPFTYNGDQDIFIRAEGESEGGSDSRWSAWQEERLNISTYSQSVDIYNYETGNYQLEPYNVHRYTVVFDYSGYAHFYTVGDVDTIGFLSDEYDWNSENSGPLYEIASDDDSGDGTNFDIEYYVEAGVEYNIYVRSYNGEDSGAVTLYVTEPYDISSSSYGTLSADKTESVSLKACKLYRRTVYFSECGTVTISSSGSIDTRGWISTSSSWSKGEPTDYLEYDDDSGSSSTNFSFTYDVVAGTRYYIWFRAYYAGDTGTTTISVTVPQAVTRPNNFSWTYSKVQGEEFNLTATEWNNFTSRVNAFREYKGLSDYSFTTAYSGNTFTAAMYNQARIAIQAISGYGTYIPTVTKGQQITAYMMNVLVSELNSIP